MCFQGWHGIASSIVSSCVEDVRASPQSINPCSPAQAASESRTFPSLGTYSSPARLSVCVSAVTQDTHRVVSSLMAAGTSWITRCQSHGALSAGNTMRKFGRMRRKLRQLPIATTWRHDWLLLWRYPQPSRVSSAILDIIFLGYNIDL
ncbi:hypothetical protein Vretimale_8706, partial [Volvox reticuliferus]